VATCLNVGGSGRFRRCCDGRALADVATSLFALFDMALRVEAEIQGVDPHMVPHLLVKDST